MRELAHLYHGSNSFLPFFAIEFLPSFLTVTLSFIAHGALIAGGRGRGRVVGVR
jgi:hypothetical protein